MSKASDENQQLKQIVFAMIRSGAPERLPELEKIWKEHSPEFIYSGDQPGFVLEAGAYGSLRVTDRTLRLTWLFGHIAWRALRLYAAIIHIYSGSESGLDFDEAESDDESKQLIADHITLIECFSHLKDAQSREDFIWPESIPLPAHTRPTNNDEETAVYDLVGMAMVFMFLHELKHIQFSNDNENMEPIEEEFACDDYAREFLLEKIKDYSIASGDDYLKVLGKRAMSIALASFLILELTPAERWGGSASHPSVYSRLHHLMDFPELDENAYYWLYLGSLLITKLRLMKIEIPNICFGSRKEFCSNIFNIFKGLGDDKSLQKQSRGTNLRGANFCA